jgi:hypothetical protein
MAPRSIQGSAVVCARDSEKARARSLPPLWQEPGGGPLQIGSV